MKPVPRKPRDEEEEDSITELKKENQMKELNKGGNRHLWEIRKL